MNPEYTEYRFPQIKPLPWEKVFRHRTPREAIDFVARLLGYDPSKRPRPLEALLDPYFDELRDPDTRLPNGQPMPTLFKFTEGKYHFLATNPALMLLQRKWRMSQKCAHSWSLNGLGSRTRTEQQKTRREIPTDIENYYRAEVLCRLRLSVS